MMKKLAPCFIFFLFSFQALGGEKIKTNRLIHESSPYLLQHAHNPVDWYPWGEEAFVRARKENKPLFISIGYSTCHWCHVMAHESFENPAIADILNRHFISVKVDREERPDIDRIYLTASELMNGYSGWPTTIIANTELKPFFAATYIPPLATQGQQGLTDILTKVITLWQEDRQRVNQVANEVTALIKRQLESQHSEGQLNASSIDLAYQYFRKIFDQEHGGFGNAPKFPRMPLVDFLISYGVKHPDSQAHAMVRQTLKRMLSGGLYDHVGGGFHRYSVDAEWQVPHFEKMLYDQGLITNSLIDASKKISDADFKSAIQQSLDFVLDKMQSAEGGFYSAYDADSTRPDNPAEHGEGAYYVWSKKELDRLLNKTEQTVVYGLFNIQASGNVVSDPQNEFKNLNVLYAEPSLQELAKSTSIPVSKAQRLLTGSLDKLQAQREKRPPPHLDDKIITSWNALIIRSLARASELLGNKQYLDAARHSARFIYRHLYNPKTQTLYRSFRKGRHSGEAYLDDYAYLINALLSLYQQTDDRQWLVWADTLMTSQIKLFHDKENQGFFDSTSNDTHILIRSKEIYDGVLPSANAITVENLDRLASAINKPHWSKLARQTLNSFHENLNELVGNYPQMYRSYLMLAD